MQLTPLQLEVQQRSDKTLSFWCILKENSFSVIVTSISDDSGLISILRNRVLLVATEQSIKLNKTIEVIWHPMNWGRLCWLYRTSMRRKPDNKIISEFVDLETRFDVVFDCYQQTVLERPIELQELVLAFLKTLWNAPNAEVLND